MNIRLKLPDGFLDEEERCGYRVSKEMKKVWAVELDLLAEFDRVCRKHNLRYLATGGTLLGAVRHQGYIPWDDDLDIEMLREDYLKLLKVLPSELPDNYALQTNETDPGYFFTYAKLRDKRSTLSEVNHYDRIFRYKGIYIDIFPLEKNPIFLHWVSCRLHGFTYNVMNNPRNSDEQAFKKVRRIYRFCSGKKDLGHVRLLLCDLQREQNEISLQQEHLF